MLARRLMVATWCAGMAVLILLSASCARSTTTRSTAPKRSEYTAKAADCGFTMPDSSGLMGESEVDEPARMLTQGPHRYPAEAREQGRGGQVTVTYVVDREGGAIPSSIKIVVASDQVFVADAIEMIRLSRFTPAIHAGQVVSVCVRQTINFTVT